MRITKANTKEYDKTKQRLNNAVKAVAREKETLKNIKEEIKLAQDYKKNSIKGIDEVENKRKDAEMRLQEKLNEERQLIGELNKLNEEVEKAKKDAESIKRYSISLQKDHEENVKKESKRLSEINSEYRYELDKIKGETEFYQEAKEEIEKDNAILAGKVDNLMEKQANLKDENRKLIAYNKEIKRDSQAMCKLQNKFFDDINESKEELSKLDKKKKEKKEELRSVDSKLSTLKKELESKKTELDNIRRQQLNLSRKEKEIQKIFEKIKKMYKDANIPMPNISIN